MNTTTTLTPSKTDRYVVRFHDDKFPFVVYDISHARPITLKVFTRRVEAAAFARRLNEEAETAAAYNELCWQSVVSTASSVLSAPNDAAFAKAFQAVFGAEALRSTTALCGNCGDHYIVTPEEAELLSNPDVVGSCPMCAAYYRGLEEDGIGGVEAAERIAWGRGFN
jgi:hypothetical protein